MALNHNLLTVAHEGEQKMGDSFAVSRAKQ